MARVKNEDGTACAKLKGYVTNAADTRESPLSEKEPGCLMVTACGAAVKTVETGHKTGGPDVAMALDATGGSGSLLLVVPEAPSGIIALHSHNDGTTGVADTVKMV